MRLIEIKPNIAIRCTSKEQVGYLVDNGFVRGWMLEKEVPIWIRISDFLPSENWMEDEKGKEYYESIGCECVEFSDLIIPELTAEEAIRIRTEICNGRNCESCPIYSLGKEHESCNKVCIERAEDVVKILSQWKSDHEKKKPEIETVDICRIIEVLPDGCKRCVHEEDIKPDTDLPYGSEQIAVEEILKRYCMEHEGKFIAVHEVISRVKGGAE